MNKTRPHATTMQWLSQLSASVPFFLHSTQLTTAVFFYSSDLKVAIVLLCCNAMLAGLAKKKLHMFTVYIRTISLLSRLHCWPVLNWFIGHLGRATCNQFLSRPARKESNKPKLNSSWELIVLIYILCTCCC